MSGEAAPGAGGGAAPGGAGAPARREVVVACREQLAFADFCIVVLGFEVAGWDATGGRFESACGTVGLRVLEGEPTPAEVQLWLPPDELAALGEAAAEAGADVVAAGAGALVVRGPELVTWLVTAAP